MRFLVDECTGSRVASWLAELGHEVFFIYNQARGSTDDEILIKAFAESWILITNDKDFGELVFRELFWQINLSGNLYDKQRIAWFTVAAMAIAFVTIVINQTLVRKTRLLYRCAPIILVTDHLSIFSRSGSSICF